MPRKDPRTTRYSMPVVRRAQQLHEAGRTIQEIRFGLSQEFGVCPRKETVKSWVLPGYAEARRREASERYAIRQQKKALKVEVEPDLLLALRMDDGLSYTSISVVLRRFCGVDLSEGQVADRLYRLGAPKNPLKARYARELNARKVAA